MVRSTDSMPAHQARTRGNSAGSRWAPGATSLAHAARAVAAVAFRGRSAEDALAPFNEAPDRAAIRAIALGSLRWYLRLAPAVESLLDRPKSLAEEVRALLVASAHQIEYSRAAPQSAVNLAVDAVRVLGVQRASGLVNAVLRRFVSERSTLLPRVDANIATRTAHPAWLIESLQRAWPDRYGAILDANNEHPPMVLRVALDRRSVPEYLADLQSAGLAGQALGWAPAAIRLDHPVSVAELPRFEEGIVSVQDAGAQLAAPLLDVRPGMRVLDACAAPGGKTGHLLELTPALGELVAVDIDAARIERVELNLRRLRRTARLVVADVRDPASFWDGRPFDRILIDAPCSGTGVIRRHPDIKLLRRAEDIGAMAKAQLEILSACFRMLAPGGRLVYCTCSVVPAENEEVVGQFLAAEPQARPAPMPGAEALAPGAIDRRIGVQLLPGAQAATDGFYYACIEKATAGN